MVFFTQFHWGRMIEYFIGASNNAWEGPKRLIQISINSIYKTHVFLLARYSTSMSASFGGMSTSCAHHNYFRISHFPWFVWFSLRICWDLLSDKNLTHPYHPPDLLSNTLVERYDTSLDAWFQMWSAAYNGSQHGANSVCVILLEASNQ